VKESDYVYVVAEDDNHRIYSNCSNFLFEIEKVYESVFDTSLDLNSYENLLTDLESLSEDHKTFKTLFQSPIYKRNHLELINYQNYINLRELSIEKYSEIVKFYSNYGVCSKVKISANYPSEFTTRITVPSINHNIQSASLQIRFVEKFKIVQPNLDLMNSNEPEILLTPESSVEWFLEGGPNLWEETRKINEIYEVEDKNTGYVTTNHFLTMNILSKHAGQKIKRHYFTKCNLPRGGNLKNDLLYAIRLFSWNEPDTKLLKPVNISVILSVSCKIPSKLQIYTFEPYQPNINIYQSQILGFEAVNLKNFADHHFQVFAYDENFLPFYNFSSLGIKWKFIKPASSVILNPM